MISSRFTHLDFLHLTVLFLCFSCYFSENYNSSQGQGEPVKLLTDPHNEEIVFRIINGNPAKLGDIPYQVAFRARSGFPRGYYYTFCGGSIIGERKLLSAAHCFHSKQLLDCCSRGRAPMKRIAKYFAIAGTIVNKDYYHRIDSTQHGQWRKLSAALYPPLFHFPIYDIAVVFVTKPFRFNIYVAPIPIASSRKEYRGTCVASGYGRLSKTHDSAVLNWANLQILSTSKCNIIHHRNMRHFICTSNIISDVYKGDSGGPLVCQNTGDPRESSRGVLVGVTSGGSDYPRDYTFFTRVSSYNRFIHSKISSCSRVQMSKWLFLVVNSVFLSC